MTGRTPPPDREDSVLVATPQWLKPQGTAGGQSTATYDPEGGGALPTEDAPPGAEAHRAPPRPASPPVPAPRGVTPPAPPAFLLHNDALSRLSDKGVLARGGFGAVHRVEDHTLMRTVAMKVMDQMKALNENAVLRFVEEAQITGQLDHPNIVPVHELGLDADGRYFFTMKLVRGRTLTAILKEGRDGADFHAFLDGVLDILIRVCDALGFAHSRGVIHRDLKPDNIMVGSFGQVYLMDWGIAQLTAQNRPSGAHDSDVIAIAQAAKDAPGTVIGTFAYMAPEQARGENDRLDARTDVFGMGAILYQTLTGRPPYEGKTPLEKVMNAQKARFPDPQEAAGRELPAALVHICLKALKADPKERYQDVLAFKADLERFQKGAFFPTRTFGPGTIIVKEGDDADAAYIITSGTCEAFKTEAGRKLPLRTMGPGDVFGETAIFTSKPRTASVRAVTALTAMVVTRASLEQELGTQSWMGSFVRALAARFREQDQTASILRLNLEDARVQQRAMEHLLLHGAGDGNVRKAPWGPMRAALAGEFAKPEAELVSAVTRQGTLAIEGDQVVFRRG